MIWLDPASPPVRSAVQSGAWGKAPHSDHGDPVPAAPEIDTIADALAIASEQLSVLTGFAIHPAGTAVEEYEAYPTVRSLGFFYAPVRSVQKVASVNDAGVETVMLQASWQLFAGRLRILRPGGASGNAARYCLPGRGISLVRVTYRFGSTVGQHARAAVLELAHEHWLQANPCDECGSCRLPANATSVTREGISMELAPNEGYLASGRTGLPGVDAWIAGVNPRQVPRRSGIYDPESPPGVVRSVQVARPTWAA